MTAATLWTSTPTPRAGTICRCSCARARSSRRNRSRSSTARAHSPKHARSLARYAASGAIRGVRRRRRDLRVRARQVVLPSRDGETVGRRDRNGDLRETDRRVPDDHHELSRARARRICRCRDVERASGHGNGGVRSSGPRGRHPRRTGRHCRRARGAVGLTVALAPLHNHVRIRADRHVRCRLIS